MFCHYLSLSFDLGRTKIHSTSASAVSISSIGDSFGEKNGDLESSKAALTQVLLDYNFTGKIIKIKCEDDYGFLRSEQISGDVFFSLHHTTGLCKSSNSSIEGKFVSFQVKDAGKKSIEARNINVEVSEPSVQFLVGNLDRWVKSGALIQIVSGLGADLPHNRIFSPFSECQSFDNKLTNVEVKFRVHMDKGRRVEARCVTLTGNSVKKLRRRSLNDEKSRHDEPLMHVKDLLNSGAGFNEDVVKAVNVMSLEEVTQLFDTEVKTKLPEISQQPVASKVIMAIIMKVAKINCNKIEESITRMIVANFLTISSCKHGCQVVLAAVRHFSEPRAALISEQLTELATVEEFTELWTHGAPAFVAMLDHLDEASLGMLGSCLLGDIVSLACNICHYKPLRSLLVKLVTNDCFEDIFIEVKENLISLSCDKYGHHVVIGLLESVSDVLKQEMIAMFQGRILQLSLDPVCYSVIVAAMKQGSSHQQGEMIEEVCRETYKQAEMEIITLAQDRHGHQVVLAMLSGTRHKHIHNILKASILCKQEELLENEYAARVFKAIKMEFHNKLAGNYPKSH